MRSSTSSSSDPVGAGVGTGAGAGHLARAGRSSHALEPAAIAGLVAVALVVALGAWTHRAATAPSQARARPAPIEGPATPLAPPRDCDVVLVGDSHVRQGIVPSVLSNALGGANVHCFAVPGMPLSPEFLRAASSGLASSEDRPHALRCLAIGVSLTTQKKPLRNRRAEFTATKSDNALERTASTWWPSQLTAYAPPSRAPRLRVSTLHPDGWRERDFLQRRDPQESASEEAWNLLAQPFDRFMMHANREALASLSRSGTRVVVFAMPSDVSVIEPMTERWAGMTALEYARAICPPDGRVLDLHFAPGDTYDGHHLHPDAARRVSAELARELAAMLAPDGGDSPAPTPPAPIAPPTAAGAQPQ
ncbi:MAG: hypothetical protein JNK53_03715 [Phycisphaerae bacterium]|nr:hypothetical protein [Phycisphaerae bacterium]